ncbi:MAG: hypothetical protein V4529_16705, partial [Gemmatimonadota bacterium]
MSASDEWVKRPYAPEDEDGIVYLWTASYSRGIEGEERGAHVRQVPIRESSGSAYVREKTRELWAEQAPLVERLLSAPWATTEVICDPERVYASAAGPAVIWGFACTSGDVVHYVSVKRDVVRAGFGPDIVRELLGDRLDRACTFTHELVEMRTGSCGVKLPRNWSWEWNLWLPRRLVG